MEYGAKNILNKTITSTVPLQHIYFKRPLMRLTVPIGCWNELDRERYKELLVIVLESGFIREIKESYRLVTLKQVRGVY